jgi:hypothetical protein
MPADVACGRTAGEHMTWWCVRWCCIWHVQCVFLSSGSLLDRIGHRGWCVRWKALEHQVFTETTVGLWTRKTRGEIWCTGHCWVHSMHVLYPKGYLYIYMFGQFWDHSLNSLNTWDIIWAREFPLHSSPCLVAHSSEIKWDSSVLLSDLHLVALDLWVGCRVLVTLRCFLTSKMAWSSGGVELVIGDCFEPHQVIVRGSWAFFRGSSRIGYSSGARGLEDPHLMSGCAALAEGLTLNSQLARDPLSGCITTTRTSLSRSKWTSVKNLMSSLCRGVHLVFVIALIDWLIRNISTHQHRYNNTCSLLYLLAYLASCLACYLL